MKRNEIKGHWPQAVQIWLERVEYDLETARAMLRTGRYLYVVFMCQQAVEKTLKAILSLRGKEVKPIHNLSKLAALAELLPEISEEQSVFIDDLSAYYLNARYKETIADLAKTIGKQEARIYLHRTKDLIAWLIQKMKSSR
jgi:HEPN domain-containing protein